MGRTDQLTVLAVDNDGIGMAQLRSMPREAIRQHLSLHVLLGYYDPDMLARLRPGETADVSTLFQPSGDARRGVGMVEVSAPDPSDRFETVNFAPAGNGAGSGGWRLAMFVRSVYEEPDVMAVLQVTATMSAPWLPGARPRRDAAGRDAKKN
jgi:hypothetical protein